MPRRSQRAVTKGVAYAVEWLEWHVDCAEAHCQEHALLAHIGMASTWQQAERLMKKDSNQDEKPGWKKIYGKWYCADHVPKMSKNKD